MSGKSGWARRRRAPAVIAAAIGCSDAASTAAAYLSSSHSSRPGAVTSSVSVIRPVVAVPVLSRTTVSTLRVFSRASGPLIRMPSCAPRPVPTRIAVGVARPIAHGQAMISTATAAVNADAADPPAGGQPADQRHGGDREHDGNEHGGDAVREALRLCLTRLCLGDEPRHLGEL